MALSHSICSLVCLPSFTWHNHVWHLSVPFYCWIVLYSMDIHLFTHSLVDEHLGYLHSQYMCKIRFVRLKTKCQTMINLQSNFILGSFLEEYQIAFPRQLFSALKCRQGHFFPLYFNTSYLWDSSLIQHVIQCVWMSPEINCN